MRFVKSHGAGNDFVLIEDLGDRLAPSAGVVAALCDRHTGIGADGLIRIAPAPDAHFFMDYYNADGAQAEMCGNGIRCLAKYVGDRGLHEGDAMKVATRAGIRDVTVFRDSGGLVDRARVNMGAPVLDAERIPVRSAGDPLHEPIDVEGVRLDAACVSMGNPHCVIFVDDLDAVEVGTLGPAVEGLEKFPARVNAEFAEVLSPGLVRARVWERGCGETLACGTGACAVVVAGALRGLTARRASVRLPGGTLEIDWTSAGEVLMTGPVEEVFTGEIPIDRAPEAPPGR
ncbi:MAG: diaminopimelate epimerase [Acidobacteria bacterium]|nr:diaminopimelate epimerase [Acidobacteriota bacterium]